jgi:hypothetical protein
MQIYFGTHLARHYKDYNIRPLQNSRPAYMSIGSQYETECFGINELQKIQNMWRANSLDGGKRIVS